MRSKSQIGGIGYQGMSAVNPGPGQYTFQGGAINKTIAYTFGLKPSSYLDRQSTLAPGPGQYNCDFEGEKSTMRNSGGAGFGTEKRAVGGLTKSSIEVPGPG